MKKQRSSNLCKSVLYTHTIFSPESSTWYQQNEGLDVSIGKKRNIDRQVGQQSLLQRSQSNNSAERKQRRMAVNRE